VLAHALCCSAPGRETATPSSRLGADKVSDLSALIVAETVRRPVVLDLEDVVLVDRDVVRFVSVCPDA